MKLKTRLLLLLAPAVMCALLTLIALGYVAGNRQASQLATAEAEAITLKQSAILLTSLSNAETVVRSLAASMLELRASHSSRTAMSHTVKGGAAFSMNYFGIWALWEENAYDKRDAEYIDHPLLGNKLGRASAYWARLEDDTLAYNIADGYYDNIYYTAPIASKKLTIIPPYLDTNTPVPTMMTSIALPIMDGEVALGVVGIDIAMDFIQGVVNSVRPYGSGYAQLITDTGVVVAGPDIDVNSGDMPTVSSEVLEQIRTRNSFVRMEESSISGRLMRSFYTPIILGSFTAPWYFKVSLPEYMIAQHLRSSLMQQLSISLVALAILMGLVFYAANSVSTPLRRIVAYAKDLAAGQPDREINTHGFAAELKDLHSSLGTMVSNLVHAAQEAESANATKSDFLAAMSHEIRTPMNAIIGMSEILARSPLTAEQGKYLADIKSSSHSLLAIINDILDFSKIEAGRMELVDENYNLHSLLENLRSIFTNLMESKGLQFVCTQDANLPASLYGDENRLRQILTNLLSNALKYSKNGRVELNAWREGNTIHFAVKDSGIGIRKEDMGKLFTPFEQLDLRKNRNVVGTGLGLAISHKLCVKMGGTMRVESEYGVGSTFYLSIPYVEASAEVEGAKEEVKEFTAPGATVLVVDDLEINLSVAEAMLEGMFGITPDCAISGHDALKMAQQKKYDIIFMDHMMPGLDGMETTKMLRNSNCQSSKSIIVALTANAIVGMESVFIVNGFDAFLPKPLDFASMNLCLRKWLPAEMIQEQAEETAAEVGPNGGAGSCAGTSSGPLP